MSTEEWCIRIVVATVAAIAIVATFAIAIAGLLNVQDKRNCRRAGDVVMDMPDMKDWRCVKATSEAR